MPNKLLMQSNVHFYSIKNEYLNIDKIKKKITNYYFKKIKLYQKNNFKF